MSDIRHIDAETGPEILTEIGTGLIINKAGWSGPAVMVCQAALREAENAGITKIFVINHDLADRFTDLFIENGHRLCQGCGDLFYVVNGTVAAKSHSYLKGDQVREWIRSAITS